MTKDEIMRLADDFAAATSNHYLAGERDAIKWQLMVDARAALEAALASHGDALTEKQEPVALHELLNQVIYGDFSTDIPENLTLALNAKKELHCLTRTAQVNQQLLDSLREVVAYCDETGNNHWMCISIARAAIAKAEGKV